MLLEGKNALVTGGSRGIGFQVCRILLENGARVLAVSRNPVSLMGAREALPGLLTLDADVSVAADSNRLAAWVQDTWGRLDILVNNAGVSPRGGAELTTQRDDVFDDTFRTNVFGPYSCTKRLLPSLLASDDPRVVNVGSSMGIMSPDMRGVYSVSKAALHALTVATANELRGKVVVNALCPGWVRTDMAPDAPGDPRSSAEAALWLVTQPRAFTGKVIQGRAEVT